MSIVSGLQWAQYDIFFAQYDINTPNINTAPANFDYNSLPERGHQALFLHESLNQWQNLQNQTVFLRKKSLISMLIFHIYESDCLIYVSNFQIKFCNMKLYILCWIASFTSQTDKFACVCLTSSNAECTRNLFLIPFTRDMGRSFVFKEPQVHNIYFRRRETIVITF